MMKSKLILFVFFLLLILGSGCGSKSETVEPFSGESSFRFLETQLSFGPRFPGSEGHVQVQLWLIETLEEMGWSVSTQTFDYLGTEITNIIATTTGKSDLDNKTIIMGAHYDTRLIADNSEEIEDFLQPVPGANDGASGVAVLLELARVLPDFENLDVQLVFFDAEDNGYLSDWDWIVGSSYFADQLMTNPEAVVIVDMIGDSEQEIYYEHSSDQQLKEEIWRMAEQMGVTTFIPEEKHHLIDDHAPFLGRGIPAVLLIDFDYPYWHTTKDTLDKVSPTSLENVGRVLVEWLIWRDSLAD